jgi:hypothetical protein
MNADNFEFIPCDRCGHWSYVFVNLVPGELSYCGSHFREYEEKLRAAGAVIVDMRHLIPA